MILPFLISAVYWKGVSVKGFEYMNDARAAGADVKLFIDSGAFTVFTRGDIYTAEDYKRDLNDTILPRVREYKLEKDLIIANLDVVADQEATNKNLFALRQAGFDIAPIITRGGSTSLLKNMLRANKKVLIGGNIPQGVSKPGYIQTCKRFDEYYSDPYVAGNTTKIHWFGFTDRNMVLKHKPGSIDSVMHTTFSKYKSMKLFNSDGTIELFKKTDTSKQKLQQLRVFCERYDLSFEYALTEEAWIGDSIDKSAMHHFISVILYLNRLQKRLNIIHYLVISNSNQIGEFVRAYLHLKERGHI